MTEAALGLNSAAYSDRQLAVAQTWAEHFRIEPKHQQAFIRSYLDNTRHTGFWTFPLPALQTTDLGGRNVTPMLARLASELQFFDGHLIWAVNLSVGAMRDLERDLGGPQALQEGPDLEQAQRLIAFVAKQGCRHRPGLLTAFSKAARDLLLARASGDLAPWGKLVAGDRWEARYYRPRSAFYGKHLGAALKRFNAHLDPEVLRLIRGIRCPDSRLYNWICEPQGNRAWRLQAVRAQPVLLAMLVLWPEELTEEQRTVPIPRRGHCPWPVLAPYVHGESLLLLPHLLGLAVDQALPLHEVLAWLFQVPVAHLRYLGRQRVYDTGGALSFLHPEDGQRAFRILLAAASTGNRRPQSQADWKAFRQFWHDLPCPIQFQRDLTHFIKGRPQQWSDPTWLRLGVRTADLSELHEGREGDHPLHTLIEQFRVQRSAVEIARLADRYQAQRRALIAQHRAALQAAAPERYGAPETAEAWPGLLLDRAAVTAPNGLVIVELLTPDALHLEHHAMDHCVDQYDYAALSGHSRLFSVRRAGTSLATAEIVRRQASPDDDDLTLAKVLTVRQLRAYGNDPLAAGSAEQQAWDWFWQELLRGRWPVRLEWPYLMATDEYALEQQAFERSFPPLLEWLEHQLRDVTHKPLSSLSALEICPMGLRYARDLHHFAESACLDELVRPLQDWSDVFTPGLACFAQRVFTSSHESVHPKQIVGYAARDHAGMSWKRLLLEGGKMAESLAWLERNPRYYFDGSVHGEQPEPIQLATLDGLEFYVVGQGLHRACIARLLVELHSDVVLRNVKVTRYDLRQDLIELCDRFNARMQALAVAPRIRPFDMSHKELFIRGGKLETYDLALLIELSDTAEWVVDVSMAERFLAEVEAACGRQPAIKQTLTARMMSRLLAKIKPLAVVGAPGGG